MGSKLKKDLKIKKKKKKEILDYHLHVGNANIKASNIIFKRCAKKIKDKLDFFDYVKTEVKQHDTNMLIRHVTSLISLSESKKRKFWIHEDFDEYRK
jgi:hypothetical protein